jgi:hypothetical protein
MPVHRGYDKNGCYYQYGNSKKYYYTCGDAKSRLASKKLAIKQMVAIAYSTERASQRSRKGSQKGSKKGSQKGSKKTGSRKFSRKGGSRKGSSQLDRTPVSTRNVAAIIRQMSSEPVKKRTYRKKAGSKKTGSKKGSKKTGSKKTGSKKTGSKK